MLRADFGGHQLLALYQGLGRTDLVIVLRRLRKVPDKLPLKALRILSYLLLQFLGPPSLHLAELSDAQ